MLTHSSLLVLILEMIQQFVSYLGPLTENSEPDEADDRSRSDGSKSRADSSGVLQQSSDYIIQGF